MTQNVAEKVQKSTNIQKMLQETGCPVKSKLPWHYDIEFSFALSWSGWMEWTGWSVRVVKVVGVARVVRMVGLVRVVWVARV